MFSLFAKPMKTTRLPQRLRKRSEDQKPVASTDIFWYEDAFHDEKPPAYVEFHPSHSNSDSNNVSQQNAQSAIPLSQFLNQSIPSLPVSKTPILELPVDGISPSYTAGWRRSKTPVLYVGQLEQARKSFTAHPNSNLDTSSAELLAAQYQALLGSRFSTPCPSEPGEVMMIPPRTIRKVRKMNSLRRLMMIEEEDEDSPSRESCSDGETLIGSDFVSTPTSEKGFSEKDFEAKDGDGDVGLQICLDMLTQELGAGLKTHKPSQIDRDSGSGLQVLLLIEAYEGLRRKLVERGGGVRTDFRRAVQVLDQWLDALHTIYGEVQTKDMGRM